MYNQPEKTITGETTNQDPPPSPAEPTPATTQPKKDTPFLVRFSRPYTFEGKEYKEIDLSRLEELSSEDFFEANRAFVTDYYINPRPESDSKFCSIIAGLASALPPEFFSGLPMREGVRVRNVVQSFFQGEGSMV